MSKIVPFKEDSRALVGNIKGYYTQLAESREIKKIKADIEIYKKIEMSPETIKQSKLSAVNLKKEIERLRQVVALPVKKLSDANQAFFKPFLEDVEDHKKKLIGEYAAYEAQQRRIAEEQQRKADEEHRRKVEEAKRKQAEADAAAAESGQEPEVVPEPIPLRIPVPAKEKSVLQKRIDVEVKDRLALARYLLKTGGAIKSGAKEYLFMVIFMDAKIKPIQDLIRRNEGNQDIVDDLRNAGVFIDTHGDYGIK